jgi:hypothetical protein
MAGADEVYGCGSLGPAGGCGVALAAKRQLLDLGDVLAAAGEEGPVGNYEGMALGGWLPDGRRVLLMVCDDNFAAGRQVSEPGRDSSADADSP